MNVLKERQCKNKLINIKNIVRYTPNSHIKELGFSFMKSKKARVYYG